MEILTHDEFVQKLNNVKIVLAGENVVLTSSRGQVEGNFSYSEGLKDLIGYELVAYGMFDKDDLLASAEMIHANFPRGFALEIPVDYIKGLELDIPDVPYRQYVIDESSLEDDNLVVSDEPLWTGDGGYSILDETEMNEQLAIEMQNLEQRRFENIEQARDLHRSNIEENSFSIVNVYDPSGVEINFSYTVGLSNKGLPEYVMAAEISDENLNSVVAYYAETALKEGFALSRTEDAMTMQTPEGDVSFDIRVVEVDPVYAVDKYLIQAPSILKGLVGRVAWIQISDSQKRFLGDEGFENQFNQPQVSTIIAS